jgi:hypothetical protein
MVKGVRVSKSLRTGQMQTVHQVHFYLHIIQQFLKIGRKCALSPSHRRACQIEPEPPRWCDVEPCDGGADDLECIGGKVAGRVKCDRKLINAKVGLYRFAGLALRIAAALFVSFVCFGYP